MFITSGNTSLRVESQNLGMWGAGMRTVCKTTDIVRASQRNGQIHLPSTSRFSPQLCKKCLSPSPEVRGSCNDSGAAAMEGCAEAVSLSEIWKVCQLAMCHTVVMLMILMCEKKRRVWMCWHFHVHALLLALCEGRVWHDKPISPFLNSREIRWKNMLSIKLLYQIAFGGNVVGCITFTEPLFPIKEVWKVWFPYGVEVCVWHWMYHVLVFFLFFVYIFLIFIRFHEIKLQDLHHSISFFFCHTTALLLSCRRGISEEKQITNITAPQDGFGCRIMAALSLKLPTGFWRTDP